MKLLFFIFFSMASLGLYSQTHVENEFMDNEYLCFGEKVERRSGTGIKPEEEEFVQILAKFNRSYDGSAGAPITRPHAIKLAELRKNKIEFGLSRDRLMVKIKPGQDTYSKILNVSTIGGGTLIESIKSRGGTDLLTTQRSRDGLGFRIPYFPSRSYERCQWGCINFYIKNSFNDLFAPGINTSVSGQNVDMEDKSQNYKCYKLKFPF